jgi:tetratricopeptide (TPR) repeat protein
MKTSIAAMARTRLATWLMAVLLVLVALALYWRATGYDFVNYDDDAYVTSNVHVQSGLTWERIKWACLNPVAANWHPLTVWSHMLVCQVFGLNPWGHHLTNVLLHALNAGLVFALLQVMTGARWRSLLVAALFAVHPLRVESVAWVAERKDVLSGFFGLLALIAYARYAKGRMQNAECRKQNAESETAKPEAGGQWSVVGGQWSLWYLLSLFLFALGLLSKPMLVTWPFVMLLLDYWPLRRLQLKTQDSRLKTSLPLLVEKIPFFVLAVAASVVTLVVQKRGGSLAVGEGLPLGVRVGNTLVSYCRHLGKLFWPTELAVFYPHPGHWPLGKVLLAGGLILGISVLLVVQRRRTPFLLMGWLWFVGMLVPVIGLVQTGGQAMADRHTYLPSLGVLILAIWGVCELTRNWRYQVLALSAAGGTAIILCLALTQEQIGYWKDSESLFRHALEVTENNYLAHNNLGAALLGKGQLDEAIRQCQEAIRLKPDCTDAHNNLGTAFVMKGQMDAAIRQYQEALRLKPDYADACYNLANALLMKGHTDEAIRQLQEALRLKPDYAQAHNNLGVALDRKGQSDEAIRHYQEALRLKPDYAEACYNLGNALLMKGQMDAAISQYQEAIRLKPDYAEAHNNLGNAFGRKGQTDAAISQFQEAVHLKPDYAEAHYGLSVALVNQGQIDEAISQYQEAIRLRPAYAEALGAMASTLDGQGKYAEAIRCYQAALKAQPDQDGILNNLAWLLASCADPSVRNGPEAVRLATRACELTGYAKPLLIGTLAAAQAEAGDFAAAIATAERAAALATNLHLEDIAAKNRELIQLYRQGQAFHETQKKTAVEHR